MKSYTLSELSAPENTSLSLNYNTAGADTLSLSGLTPEWVARLNWQRWERIILADNAGHCLFSGLVTEGAEMAASGGENCTSSLVAVSDWSLLEHTAYINTNDDGTPVLGQKFNDDTPTAPLSTVLTRAFAAAANWTGSQVGCSLSCNLPTSRLSIPVNATGGESCAGLMLAAMQWDPDAVIRMSYPDTNPATGSGLTMHIDDCMALPPVTIEATPPYSISTTGEGIDYLPLGFSRGLTAINLRPRPDLVLPAAALIGAQHFSIGGDPREPGAFVYCVPRPAEDDGLAPAEAGKKRDKSIILGLDLPPRSTLRAEAVNQPGNLQPVDAATHELIARAFPAFAALGPGEYHAGPPLVTVLPMQNLRPQPTPGRLLDPDAESSPANYDPSFIAVADRPHIHIEGSFPASARASRNIPGLKWCRATLSILVAVDHLPAALTREEAESIFPGYMPAAKKKWNFAELTITCNLINSGYRAVRGTEALSTDPEYGNSTRPEADPNYISLLRDYYNASQTLCHEGSVTLHAPTVHPSDLLGRRIRIAGLAAEWEGMTAVCRSISYDPIARSMTLELGPRDVLGFDMRLERQSLSLYDERNHNDTAGLTDSADPEATEKEEENLMVEPSLEAAMETSLTGRIHKPFSDYQGYDDEGYEAWTFRGGRVRIGHEELTIPTTTKAIIAGSATDQELHEPGNGYGPVRHRIYRTTKNGKKSWTFDVTQSTPTTPAT